MAEPSDYPCSSSSEDDEYSDPLEVAASAGARLSTPEKASISRKRKVQTNPAEKKRNVRGSVDPNVSTWDRVNEFKDQCLTTVSGNLRCDACREALSKKKSSVKKHVSPIKHIKALENMILWLWFYTTYTRVCQGNFTYLISLLAKFVLFEYNHVVIVIESQYRESDFYDLGWERLSLTILMSQYDIIMYTISMQSEIYSLNFYLSC